MAVKEKNYFELFKIKILKNISQVDIDWEIGICQKRIHENTILEDEEEVRYYEDCLSFLKSIR